jgi:hypothetical protein
MTVDGTKARDLVAWAEEDPSCSAQALGECGELDTTDPDVQDAAQVLVTMARAVNVTAGLAPESEGGA